MLYRTSEKGVSLDLKGGGIYTSTLNRKHPRGVWSEAGEWSVTTLNEEKELFYRLTKVILLLTPYANLRLTLTLPYPTLRLSVSNNRHRSNKEYIYWDHRADSSGEAPDMFAVTNDLIKVSEPIFFLSLQAVNCNRLCLFSITSPELNTIYTPIAIGW